jgi:ABC-type phosphate/phosphonate transport system ATPase subunit
VKTHLKGKKLDLAQLGKAIVDSATKSDKNPAAVALGRLGGLKGGHARAKKLSKAKRKAIARRAAKSRWAKKR